MLSVQSFQSYYTMVDSLPLVAGGFVSTNAKATIIAITTPVYQTTESNRFINKITKFVNNYPPG